MIMKVIQGTPQAGDIIFFRTNGSWWDFFILMASPNYTHVGFFIDSSHYIEASIKGTHKTTWNPKAEADIFRIEGVTDEQIQAGITQGLSRMGEKYSVFEAIVAGVLRVFRLSEIADRINNNWICSEFVAFIVRIGMGMKILERLPLQNILPDDLKSWNKLMKLKGAF